MKSNKLKFNLLFGFIFICLLSLFLYLYFNFHHVPNNIKSFLTLYKDNQINFIDSIHGYEFDKRYRSYTHVRLISKTINNEYNAILIRATLNLNCDKINEMNTYQKGKLRCENGNILFNNSEATDTSLWKNEEIYASKLLDLHKKYNLHAKTSPCGNDPIFVFHEGKLFNRNNSYASLPKMPRRIYLDSNWIFEKGNIFPY
jgi:hypothetical protein